MRSFSLVALALVLAACSTTDPIDDTSSLVSFQRSGLTVGAAVYFCNKWLLVPDGDPLVLDLFFSFDADAGNFAPDVEDLEKLEAAGATILHSFNVSGARAEVPRDSLYRITGPAVNHVRSVPVADRFDLWMDIGYLPEAEEGIQRRAVELGGHIEYTRPGYPGGLPSFFGVLPDAAIKQLRQEFPEQLKWAEHETYGCLAGP